jgi:hypothetical protein
MTPDAIAALLPVALRAAGVPDHIARMVDVLSPQVASQLWGLLQRHEAGVPLHVLRAQAPSPTAAMDEVDRSLEGHTLPPRSER